MIFGTHDDNTLEQYEEIKKHSVRSALMADGHFGYTMPVGGVAAYRDQVSVAGVGVDIACGNAAVCTGVTLEQFGPENLPALADQIWRDFSFGAGGVNTMDNAPRNSELFNDRRWHMVPLEHREKLRETARNQLGTIGGGNHYIDVFVDPETQLLWVGVHFGSRRLGFDISNAFISMQDGGKWGERGKYSGKLLDIAVPGSLGDRYMKLMDLAGDYAYSGRSWVVATVAHMISSGMVMDYVHNHHNFAWRETHPIEDGVLESLIVIRKGATPAWPGQRGFVGGSMGDNAVILQGSRQHATTIEERDLQEAALFSTVHGAGRVMGRMQAKGKRNKDGTWKREPMVIQSEVDEWIERMGVIVRGGGLDEAPQAYRRLDDVLAAQGSTVEVLHTLKPLIVCMADDSRRSR